ncbi:MAG: DUF4294 domain-containing protein [Candidatus Cryptobacteroides sp.]
MMKQGPAYSLAAAVLALLLAAGMTSAQEKASSSRQRRNREKERSEKTSVKKDRPPVRERNNYLGYRLEEGDTVYYDAIAPIWVFPKGSRNTGNLREYYRLVYNFNKVYPYALAAKQLTQEVDSHIAENSLRRAKKEKYINQMQKELFDIYEKPLKNMTISQGKLLIKLIDREIGKSSYMIIRDYKNKITAGFWQGIAKIFGNDLKSAYDPLGEDRVTEYLVEKWESGEFDSLYYSIFWEMPEHPAVVSKRIQFED